MKLNIYNLITMGTPCSALCIKKIPSPYASIGILSLTERRDIRQFINEHNKSDKFHLHKRILEFNELKTYEPPSEWIAVILLHSAKLGRLSLTDVPDARYDRLLENLHKNEGNIILNRVFVPPLLQTSK